MLEPSHLACELLQLPSLLPLEPRPRPAGDEGVEQLESEERRGRGEGVAVVQQLP